MFKKSLVLASMVFSLSAHAAYLQDKQIQVNTGELFEHNLFGPQNVLSDGVLTVTTRGDFHAVAAEENYSLSIYGIVLGTNISFSTPGAYAYTEYAHNDHEFSIDFSLDNSLLSAIMSDSLAIVLVDFNYGVNPIGPNNYSQVTLSYSSVPLPTAAWLFGTALIGLVGIKRKGR